MSRRTHVENKPLVQVHQLTPVAPVIPSNGCWSGDNQLGIFTQFAPDSNNRQTVLKLDEWGPPVVWTISLALRDSLQFFHAVQLKAIVEFGAGGSTQTVELDWDNGAQISLPMNALNVIAEVVNVDAFTTEGPGLQLGVQIARGRRGGSVPPKLTLLSNQFLANLGQADVTIPPFATDLFAIPSDPGTIVDVYDQNFTIQLWSGSTPGLGVVLGVLRGTELLAGRTLPVVAGARSARVTNASGHFTSFTLFANLDG
jgi:hypothetical protein